MPSKILLTNPKYISKKTRLLIAIFPKYEKEILQHHLNVIGAQGIEQSKLMQATFDRPEEYDELWNSEL